MIHIKRTGTGLHSINSELTGGWPLQKLAGGGMFDVFAEGGSAGIAAIIITGILAFFVKDTGSAANQTH